MGQGHMWSNLQRAKNTIWVVAFANLTREMLRQHREHCQAACGLQQRAMNGSRSGQSTAVFFWFCTRLHDGYHVRHADLLHLLVAASDSLLELGSLA